MVSCRTCTEDSETYKSGYIQNIWRSTHEIIAGRNGRWLSRTPCWQPYWRTTKNNAKFAKGYEPQGTRYLVHELLKNRPHQRQLSTRYHPTGHPLCSNKKKLWYLLGTWTTYNKILSIQHEEWKSFLVHNLRSKNPYNSWLPLEPKESTKLSCSLSNECCHIK